MKKRLFLRGCGQRTKSLSEGFSLIEVVIAIGIIVFAMIPLVGLLATGLRTESDSTEQARAMQLMSALSAGIQSARDAGANSIFGAPFPTNFSVGTSVQNFGYTEGGVLLPESDTSTADRRGSVVLLQPTRSGLQKSSAAYVSVAWPASARWNGTKWIGASGSLESVVYFATPE